MMQPAAKDVVNPTAIAALLRQGNLSQASQFCLKLIQNNDDDPRPHYYLALIAESLDLYELANHHCLTSRKLKPDWPLHQALCKRLERRKKNSPDSANSQQSYKLDQYLLIKPWGFGFWSDVNHVIGQLLVAELSGRVPVIYWGKESLFNVNNEDSWRQFFMPVSDVTAADLEDSHFSFYPSRWNAENIYQTQDKFQPSAGKMESALTSLNRSERVIVSDYFTGIKDLIPWIAPSSKYFGLTAQQVYHALIHQYLKPSQQLQQRVDRFYQQHLTKLRYLAVHIRGSDKILEVDDLSQVNSQYEEMIESMMVQHQLDKIFLMTDDANLLNKFQQRYGEQLITTDCSRTENHIGIHCQQQPEPHQLGLEVATDVYLATRAEAFIGNGFSNPSLMVSYLKDWSKTCLKILGPKFSENYNLKLYSISSPAPKTALQEDVNRYHKGLKFFQNHQPEKLTIWLKPLCEKPLHAAAAHQLLGLSASRCGEEKEAIRHLETALFLEPENGEFYLQLAEILRRNNELEKAQKYAEQAVTLLPNHPAAFNNLGVILRGLGRLEAAGKAFTDAIARNNQYHRAFFNLGGVLQNQGQSEQAKKCYQNALSIKPDYQPAQKALNNLR